MDAIQLLKSANSIPSPAATPDLLWTAVGGCFYTLRPGFPTLLILRPFYFMSQPLTVLIPCKNEREQLAACIRSAKGAATEILVADSGSTDGSTEIARALRCRVIEREYRTYGDFQNWAIPQASCPWVFVLDSDERVTPALAAEIRAVLERPAHNGYSVRRRNHFLGRPIRFGPWMNDKCVRLFRRDECRYVGDTDHAHAKLRTGTVGALREYLIHYTCTSYEQYLPKLQRYAGVQAGVWHQQGRRTNAFQLLLRGPLRFLQGYIGRLGFLDGVAGLQVCALIAYLSYLKHARLWELQQTQELLLHSEPEIDTDELFPAIRRLAA
jgi:glycosyltransferase involved in cell wall biosynthesis